MISVIIPVYNVVDYLPRCLDSVLKQTFTDFEVLLINDGSNDGSESICDNYKRLDSRIRVYHKGNEGVDSARNLGLMEAKGEFISFIDSDDYVHPDYLKKLYDTIYTTKADIVICNYQIVNAGILTKPTKIVMKNESFKISQTEMIYNLFNNVKYMTVWGKLYKKELLKDDLFLIPHIGEDVEYNSRIYLKSQKFECISDALYYWMTRPESITRKRFSMKNIDTLISYKRAVLNIPSQYPLYQSFALEKLFKLMFSIRYDSLPEFKLPLRHRMNQIYKEIIHLFLRNKCMSISLKWTLLIFYYSPLCYRVFRFWKEKRLNYEI